MISVTHLITGLGLGGAEAMLYKLVSHTDRKKFLCRVISLTNLGVMGDLMRQSGVQVDCLELNHPRHFLSGILKLRRLLKGQKPDILQTWLYHADFIGFLVGKLMGIPRIIWSIRCGVMDFSRYAWTTSWIVHALVFLSSWVDGIIINSQEGRRVHEEMGYCSQSWWYVPNGFDTIVFSPLSKKESRALLGLPQDLLLIGLVGRYDPMKDHRNFIQAATKCTAPGLGFVMVGTGITQDNKDLKSFIPPDLPVYLLGEQHHMPRVMNALDILCLSSKGEGFPNVLGEAMSCEVPCVVTDVGEAKEIVGNSGMVVPPQDSKSLAFALQKMIFLTPQQRHTLGHKAREQIVKNYGIDSSIKKFQDIWESQVS